MLTWAPVVPTQHLGIEKTELPSEDARLIPERWTIIAAGLLSLFFLSTTLYIANKRLLWYDEIVTALLSRQSWPVEILRLLKTGIDQQPLPYYLLVKLFGKPLGYSAFALRLPSALAVFTGLLVVFDCTRRLTDGLHGLLALSFLSCTVLPYYGFEARPYAIVFMCSACSLWLWVHTPRDSRRGAFFFGVAVLALLISHYYAAFCLIPYALSVLFEIRQKAVPPKIIAAAVAAAAGLALMLPVAGTLRGLSSGFWAPASLSALVDVFLDFFSRFVLVLPLIALWIAIASRPQPAVVPVLSMQAPERLAWFFLTIPFAGFLVAELLRNNAFYHRYFIGFLPGVAVAFSISLWRYFRHCPMVSAGLLCLLAGLGILLSAAYAVRPERAGPSPLVSDVYVTMQRVLQAEDLLDREGKHFVVVPLGSHLALEALYNSSHPERYRILEDPNLPPSSLQQAHHDKEIATDFHLPMQIWHLNDVKDHASDTVLINVPDEVLASARRLGITVEDRFLGSGLRVTYLAQSRQSPVDPH